MPTICQGCSKSFGGAGGPFLQHIRKSTSPACKAFGESIRGVDSDNDTSKLLHQLLNARRGMTEDERNKMGPAMTVDPSGDHFGDYADLGDHDVDMDFVGPSIEVPVDEGEYGSDGSDDEDYLGFNDEQGWEPEVVDSRAPSPDLVFPEGHFDEPSRLPHSRPPPPMASNSVREPFIVQYPDPRAGAPIRSQEAHEHQRYADKLGSQDANPWVPFKSQMDWEIARWAKMRGPSSTAFTELLGINGVRSVLLICVKDEIFNYLIIGS